MSNTQLLSSVDIFSDLSEAQIKRIEAVCQEVTFGMEEAIFEENSPSKEFYVILEGKVAIQLSPFMALGSSKMKPKTIASLDKGQSFGEVSLVDEGVRSATAVSLTEKTRLLKIDRNDFVTLLKDDVHMGFTVMTNLASDLCFKIRNSNLMIREAMLY
ncbi:MAG: cyclic nucleotide-binding domain-containing protein [Anaerolineae bacterium]|nr:MAG: cyclic nucleotide-binding domain-containing protein [Anaerolineae bacterium]